jgi:hypothetical protein
VYIALLTRKAQRKNQKSLKGKAFTNTDKDKSAVRNFANAQLKQSINIDKKIKNNK